VPGVNFYAGLNAMKTPGRSEPNVYYGAVFEAKQEILVQTILRGATQRRRMQCRFKMTTYLRIRADGVGELPETFLSLPLSLPNIRGQA
jgi:hypothetical protein